MRVERLSFWLPLAFLIGISDAIVALVLFDGCAAEASSNTVFLTGGAIVFLPGTFGEDFGATLGLTLGLTLGIASAAFTAGAELKKFIIT